jgi:hypothetical protein
MWPFGKAFNSILVTDDETGIVKQYLFKIVQIETYADNMQDCIMVYRKDKHNVYVECITFEKEFKQKCLEDDTWLEKTIIHHAKKDLKEYCKNLQFNELINKYKFNKQSCVVEYINKANFIGLIVGMIVGFGLCKWCGI